jgi:thioesterase domain-containing protein
MTRNDSSPIVAAGHPLVVPFRTAGDGAPLFCFPGAGGNAHIFEEMTVALPEGQPVYAIDMESLCESEQEFTIEQLAVVYLEVVRSVQRTGPYYFCGYSFGGLVAYEIAFRLIAEGDNVNLVGLLDAANPAMLSNLCKRVTFPPGLFSCLVAGRLSVRLF